MVKGELLTLGAAATAMGGAYKLGEFIYRAKRLRDVGPSNAVYVRIIGRVRSDLDEVRRLLSVREVHDALESNPEKSKWVYGAMRDVRGALENITPHTERVAGDVEDGRRVGVRHRVYWLLSEKEKLENREKELQIAHASLSEVLGYLTALEPVEETQRPKSSSKKETHVDIDIHHEAPQHTTERVDREVWVERDAAPRRVEEHRDVWIEHDRQGPPPPHYEEHRDVYVDERERGPHHYEERGRDPRYEAQYDERYEQQDHYERRPQYPEERRRDDRPFPEPLGRRPESFEDRLPERDSWMQSEVRNRSRGGQYGPYGQYAEYGAPQPVGAAHYQRRFQGDAGFGDEEILNPQPVPLDRKYAEREMWIEQKEDYRFDQYGNRLPDRYFQPPVPRPYRSRM
ncbi:Nn.00g022640.m01.CDS01 [Neocucurbitaria sp. VM-36]